MESLSDQNLLRMFCRGDRSAFDALFRRYAPRAHATAYRMTANWEEAEDILQEVFVRLARHASMIRRGGSLAAWIYRTTINCSTDVLRRRKPSLNLNGSEAITASIIHVESLRRETAREEALRREELFAQIEMLVPRLPQRQAAVFVLRSFQGLAHREIAAIIGCSETTAKSHYSLACAKLRQWIAEAEKARDGNERAQEGTS